MKKFQTGRIVKTPGVHETFDDIFLFDCMHRHLVGDWGEVDSEDWKLNDQALSVDSRLLSVYSKDGVKLWIITEADRSATTFLLPGEY